MTTADDPLRQAARCTLADLEGILPEFEPSGDRTHPAWQTVRELKAALALPNGPARPPQPGNRLHRAASALHARMGEYTARDGEDVRAIDRERGWLEAVAHLAGTNGLSHAGVVEGEKMVAASRDWFAGIGGGGPSL